MTYKLLDSGFGKKLEQIGPYTFIRPAAGAVWAPFLAKSEWKRADAEFTRQGVKDGKWHTYSKNIAENWTIDYGQQKFSIKRTDFGHIGLFAEQADNWQRIFDVLANSPINPKELNVLNLFAYTGGSTIAAARSGANVVHLDASKTSVEWAKENCGLNGLSEAPIRYIVDDVIKFVQREVRRGNKYHGIILDPPSFGRGTKGQVWKIEEHLVTLLQDLKQILAEDFEFLLLSAHSDGYTPLALKNILSQLFQDTPGSYEEYEMLVSHPNASLPSGASCLFIRS